MLAITSSVYSLDSHHFDRIRIANAAAETYAVIDKFKVKLLHQAGQEEEQCYLGKLFTHALAFSKAKNERFSLSSELAIIRVNEPVRVKLLWVGKVDWIIVY